MYNKFSVLVVGYLLEPQGKT